MGKKSQPGNLFGADFGLASYRADSEIGPLCQLGTKERGKWLLIAGAALQDLGYVQK